MSLSESLPLHLIRTIQPGGERWVFLVDERGLEEDYSTLFATATIRNAALSVATHEAALNAINVLYGFSQMEGIDLISRFKAGEYLTSNECEALSNYARHNFGAEHKRRNAVIALGKGRRGYNYSMPSVERKTQYMRLTHIARFVGWLGRYLLPHKSNRGVEKILEMQSDILLRRLSHGKKGDDFEDDEFTLADNDLLNEIIAPGSPKNPFDEKVQFRNFLIVELLRQTGMRRGELLSLRVKGDIDQVKRQIKIVSQHDTAQDPRVNQPLVKTLDHAIPITQYLVDLIVRYVKERRSIPSLGSHGYLFVTHKAGPTQGYPLSKASIREMFNTVRKAEPRISHLTPHKLRHLFSAQMAHEQLEGPNDANSKELHRRTRNLVAGRRGHSEVDSLYTQAETKRQVQEPVLAVQNKLTGRFQHSLSKRDGSK